MITDPHANLPYGWNLVQERWLDITTTQLPAPESVIHLIKCGCGKTKCGTGHGKCRNAGLKCTDLCNCSEIHCENREEESPDDEDEDSGDDQI